MHKSESEPAPRLLLVPDSFKGTLDSVSVCARMRAAVERVIPQAHVREIPVADGGEGSVQAFLHALGGRRVTCPVPGPYLQEVEAFYGILPDGETAVVEMAAAAGLPLVGEDRRPAETSTFGVGKLFLHAARAGCRKILVGLGGSATNDAGVGAAAACGVRFLDADGREFLPTGGTLRRIHRICTDTLDPALSDVEFITMCDIDNPLFGPTGAAHIFAPQKGADPAMVAELDAGLRHFAQIAERDVPGLAGIPSLAEIPGAGAAGGMGAGMVAFFRAKLQPGIDTVLDAARFDELLLNTDLVFTGEGKLDTQSLRGKVVVGVARRAQRRGVPVVALVGDIGDFQTDGPDPDATQRLDPIYAQGVTAVFSINREARAFGEVRARAPFDLTAAMENVLRLYRTLQKAHFHHSGDA